MPIYSYRCETCGFQQDVLRKMSDPLLVTCPSCGAATFQKQVTAAGFQLKGSGWYVTDFRNPAGKEASKAGKPDGDAAGPTKSDADPGSATPAAPDAASPAKPAAPAAPKGDVGPVKASPPPASGTG